MLDAINDWLNYCRRNYAVLTVGQYQRVLTRFCLYTQDRPLDQIAVTDIEAYIDTLLKERGHNTGNSHLTALKSFWTWQHTRYGAPNLAALVPLLIPDDPEQRVLSEEEYARVLAVCSKPEEKDVIQFYAHTGVRRGELLRLKWSDVAPDLLSFRVRCGKGHKPRTVPIDAITRNILTRNHDNGNTLHFLLRYGTPDAQNRLCLRLAVRASIAAFGPHALRHLFATRMFKAGRPAKIISKILGHSSLMVTEKVYCHLIPIDLIGMTDGFTT